MNGVFKRSPLCEVLQLKVFCIRATKNTVQHTALCTVQYCTVYTLTFGSKKTLGFWILDTFSDFGLTLVTRTPAHPALHDPKRSGVLPGSDLLQLMFIDDV